MTSHQHRPLRPPRRPHGSAEEPSRPHARSAHLLIPAQVSRAPPGRAQAGESLQGQVKADRPPGRVLLSGALLTDRGKLDDVLIGAAQVHATLVLAAATAMAGDFRSRRDERLARNRRQYHEQPTSVNRIGRQRFLGEPPREPARLHKSPTSPGCVNVPQKNPTDETALSATQRHG
jgi:hypothetical protein